MTTEIRFEPTLFIFLGTSAGQVGWRLKSLLHKAYGDVPVLRFLWVDADSNHDENGANWFSRDKERVDLTGFNGDAVLANLNAYPAIRRWWPRESRLKPGFIQRGAKQIRPYGRLALFRKFSDRSTGPSFIDKLRASVETIQNIENFDATESMSADNIRYIVERGSARVFLVFSTCGGTGSSMTFDVAYLCRNLFRNTDVAIIGVSILPPVIDKAIKNETQIQWEKIRANTYAWFKENDYLLENPYWNVSYPEGAPVIVHTTPFNLNFVVDLGNQAGNRLNSEDDIFTLIAQAIFLDTGSSIGGAMRGFNANVSVLLDEFRGRPRAYSSLAAASLIYPAEKIHNYCGAMLAKSAIQAGFLGKPSPDEVVEEAAGLNGRLRLRDTQLLVDLLVDRQVTQLNAPIIRKAKEIERIRNLLDKQDTLDAEERERQSSIIAVHTADALRKAQKQFTEEIANLTMKRGVYFAQTVLNILSADANARGMVSETTSSIHGFKIRLIQQGVSEEDLSHAKEKYQDARKRLREMESDPRQAVLRLLAKKAWQRRLDGIRNDALRWLKEVNQISLQLSAQREAANFYDQIIHLIQELKVVLAEITQQSKLILKEFGQIADENLKPATAEQGIYEMALEVVDSEYIHKYYLRHASNIDPVTVYRAFAQGIETSSLQTMIAWTKTQFEKSMLEHARGYFSKDIENTSLLEALVQYHQEEAETVIETQFDRLVQHCHPFWQYNQDSGIRGLEGKSIIGVEDEHSELIPARYRNNLQYEIKSTGFKHEIHAARILHGLPAFLLGGMDEYKTYYEAKRKGIDPLHVIREANLADTVFPEEKGEARRLFAVSAAFGYIVQIGTWYYFDPDKEHASSHIHPGRENQLAQGRENAENTFIQRLDLTQQAESLLEREIVRMGNEAAIAVLEDCILAHKESLSKMSIENELRRQYEKEIRAMEEKQRQLGFIAVE